jgi:hypothetical protein
MQKFSVKGSVSKFSLSGIMILISLFVNNGCSNSSDLKRGKTIQSAHNQVSSPEESTSYLRYSSFQNPDSTWGFTIFVNSRPFLLYKKIPVNKAESGFNSKKDAESVAALFMKMVKNGDTSPKLTKKALDTLGIILKKR